MVVGKAPVSTFVEIDKYKDHPTLRLASIEKYWDGHTELKLTFFQENFFEKIPASRGKLQYNLALHKRRDHGARVLSGPLKIEENYGDPGMV